MSTPLRTLCNTEFYLLIMLPNNGGSRKYWPFQKDIDNGIAYAKKSLLYRILFRKYAEIKFSWAVLFANDGKPIEAWNSNMQSVPLEFVPWLNTN